MDTTYRDRIVDAILGALIEAGMSDTAGRRVTLLKSGEILDAFMSISATLLASAPDAATPSALRDYCDGFAERLYARVLAAQAQPAVFDGVRTDGMH